MCLHPVYIKNPNYKRKLNNFSKLVDCTSQYIPINCGHCSQCIAMEQIYQVQRIQMESINNYLFMAMLSYNNDSLSRLEVNGFSIPFADIKDIQNTFKLIRKNDAFTRPFKYIAVSELGGKKGRPHFHLIISIPKYCVDDAYTPLNLEKLLYKELLKYWSHNVGSNRKPFYKPNLTYKQGWRNGRLTYNYDLHYIVPYATDKGVASAAFYCLKYMLKLSDREKRLQQALRLNLSDSLYNFVYNTVKSRKVASKGFGLIKSSYDYNSRKKITSDMYDSDIKFHIRKGIIFAREKSPFPFYLHPDDGSTFPLSPFYRKYFLTLDDALCFWHYKRTRDDKPQDDGYFEQDYTTIEQFNQAEKNFNRLLQIVDSEDIEYFL